LPETSSKRENRRPVAVVGTTGDQIMKRDNLVRLTRFKVNEKRRQVEQLELMMGEFARMAADLDAQILSEEKKAGITDISHFAYPTFAKAARARRDNLTNSVKDLKVQLNAARIVQEEAEAELVNAEKLEQRDEAEERRSASA
jgi:flagellar export protein FliJ